jgi:hypothetical protein
VLAAAGGRLLYAADIGLGFLSTVRADGGPRVHPICPLLTETGLYGLIVPGPKLADLCRDGRYALAGETNPPPRQDDAVYLAGVVRWPDDRALRVRLDRQMLEERKLEHRWPGFDQQVLVEFLIERCLVTLTASEGKLSAGHTRWAAP